jgi:hypothetical protein
MGAILPACALLRRARPVTRKTASHPTELHRLDQLKVECVDLSGERLQHGPERLGGCHAVSAKRADSVLEPLPRSDKSLSKLVVKVQAKVFAEVPESE